MIDFLRTRMRRKALYIPFFLGITIVTAHLLLYVFKVTKYQDLIFTPYTSWLSVKSTHITSLIFYFALPIVAVIGAAGVFGTDKKIGLLEKLSLYYSRKKIYVAYLIAVFLIGFSIAFIPMVMDIIGSFSLLPNLMPDELINRNSGMVADTTIFIQLFFTHPFIHMLFYLLFASIWSGLFAVTAFVISLYTHNQILPLLIPFSLQIILFLISNIFTYKYTIVPFNFLSENATIDVNGYTCLLLFVGWIAVVLGMFWYKVKKDELL